MAVQGDLRLVDHGDDGVALAFRADVLSGLAARQKAIPARWFYDLAGSKLFERITELPEYYPTRAETALLEDYGPQIAQAAGLGRVVVEFGSGSSVKTPLLLREVSPAAYVPIDISGAFLRQSSAVLAAVFPELPILPVEADFMKPVRLPKAVQGRDMFGFFPGSTIGNMVPRTAIDLLRSMRATLGDGARLLVGIDRLKDIATLLAAYDDAQGITAQFNLNLLVRINRELAGDIPVERFRHVARWNADWSRIEMHLQAQADMSFTVAGHRFTMKEGETIHTENSHKYQPDQARFMLQASGWTPRAQWSDADENFLLILGEATEPRYAP